MAIQNRRGSYTHFDPTKMVAGEFAVVQQNDPNATDGKSVYIAFSPNDVKRLATHEELENYNQEAQLAAEAAEEAQEAAEAALANVQTLKTATETAAGNAAQSAQDAADTLASVETSVQAMKEQALEDFAEEAEEKHDELLEDIIAHGEVIKGMTTNAEAIASQALDTANNAENHMATLDTQMREVKTALNNVSIDPDDLGLYQDADTYYVYPTYKGVVSENGIPLSGAGGGGGGGDVVSAVLTVENTTGWLSRTIASGSDCNVSLTWSSIEDGMATGDGNIRITVNDVVKTTYQISQGSVSVNLAPYLTRGGTYKVKIRISDTYDQGKTITFNITAVELTLTSTFDASTFYNSVINFPFVPVGDVEKTVYRKLDGVKAEVMTTPVSGRQMSFTIPAQTHGAHTLEVWFESVINTETVESNHLYYEFLFVDQLSTTPIIASSFSATSMPQYSTVALPFLVYTPSSLTSEVTISVNGTVVATQTVDRTEQSYSYKANQYGTLTFVIATGNVSKTISLTITESDIDVEAETEDLALYLSSTRPKTKSNTDTDRNVWTYGEGTDQIACTFNGFNWVSDGWQKDSDGATLLRVSGNARVTIPYQPFAQDFRTTGKTIELEFSTRSVLDYDSVILSCMSGGRGLELTPQKATLKSEQSEISVQYKENEHIRVAFVVEKRSENSFIIVYIDSIPSGVIQYPSGDDFSQTSPVDITIGSNDATIDLYCIRVYDNDLTRHQVLDNWIADTIDGTEMLDRYSRNNIFDAYGKITIANLPSYIPHFILNADELPQYKGDKKTITGTYTDPMFPSKSFTFEGCQINVQGTTSAKYARKNYDLQFKEGFELASGHANQYALRTGAIPFNRFVLKADVASSEGANNVELVRLYNDACPYKTPEMVEDPRVRWGIDGFPIVVFWNDTATGTVKFLGKYNFNLPKRAPAPYGYANDDTMESWEFQNNRDALMLFQSDYFNMEMRTDPDTGDIKEAWRFDYEARFPSDEWTDIDILQEFQTFVYSTWRQEATGNALESSVTYNGVTYTNDTAEYRLAKFKNEFPTYAELDSFLFYYIFTELFLLVDSRAKNLFIGFNGSPVTASGRHATRKATAQPYDMDTAMGTNNEGSLVNSYNVEDTDYGSVFTGEGSVLWENVRDAFGVEITQMYQSLRSQGILSYDIVEARFEEHQSVWSEAIWIEDSWFKYIDPLANPDTGVQPSSIYLPMMQGSKEQQRKWWLSNRFRYMDSKWHSGDALVSPIQLRAYSKGNVTVTPYFDIYATVQYGTPIVTARATHDQPITMVCPPEVTTFDDTEIYIYSARQIASLGDLSPLKIGLADISAATNLQELIVGSPNSSYSNEKLYQLTFGSNKLLQKIDVRNCVGLGDTDILGHTQTTVDISNCEVIEEAYFDGTKIKGLTLPNGGVLRVLSLPNTITSLVVQNQTLLTNFSVTNDDYSNIQTLRIENCSSVIPVMDILDDIQAGSRVRIIGFTTTASGVSDSAKKTDIENFYDYLDTMRGLNEKGENVDTAQVQGTITGIDSLTGAWLAQMKARYPYIDIAYNHITSNLYYYNGETLHYTESVTDGGNGVYAGTPTKANSSDGHYSYTFAGWSKDTDDGTVDADARTAVTADRNVYACYTQNVRTYTVTWVNNGTTIETDSNVPWGTVPHYDGSTPTKDGQTSIGWLPDPTQPITGNTTFTAQYLPVYTVTFKNDTGSTTLDTQNVVQGQTATYGGSTPTSSEDASLAFLGWATSANSHTANAVLTNVQSNMTVYAAFEAGVEVAEITDSWDTIIANIDNGTYATKYSIGNYKPLDLGETYGTVNMQIVAMDADELASGGTAPLTFLSMELLLNSNTMYGTSASNVDWNNSSIRSTLMNDILPQIPTVVSSRLQTVIKHTYQINSSTSRKADTVFNEKLWIPSFREVEYSNSNAETLGVDYRKIYNSSSSREKTANGVAKQWWTRTAQTSTKATLIQTNGSQKSAEWYSTAYICLGFCLGLEQETISDDWSTILANTNPSASYSIGDTKMIDLGTEGKHLMEIVAFNEDDKADGSGKAKITWLSKDLLKTIHRMNPENDGGTIGTGGNGGWENCEMRTYLKETIKPLIPETVRNAIVNVTKIQSTATNGSKVIDGQTTTDDVWIPSVHEILSSNTNYETTGTTYSSRFNSGTSRIKKWNHGDTEWWLRSVRSSTNGMCVTTSGNTNNISTASAYGIALGFCTD